MSQASGEEFCESFLFLFFNSTNFFLQNYVYSEMNALSLTQENIINLHKSKGCTKIHKSQNPTKYMFVLAR